MYDAEAFIKVDNKFVFFLYNFFTFCTDESQAMWKKSRLIQWLFIFCPGSGQKVASNNVRKARKYDENNCFNT